MARPDTPSSRGDRRPRRVLVADDEDDIRALVCLAVAGPAARSSAVADGAALAAARTDLPISPSRRLDARPHRTAGLRRPAQDPATAGIRVLLLSAGASRRTSPVGPHQSASADLPSPRGPHPAPVGTADWLSHAGSVMSTPSWAGAPRRSVPLAGARLLPWTLAARPAARSPSRTAPPGPGPRERPGRHRAAPRPARPRHRPAAGRAAALLEQVQSRADELDRASRILAARARTMTSVIDAVTEQSIIGTDPDGMIRVWNPGAEKMLGLPRADVVRRRSILDFHLAEELGTRRGRRRRPTGSALVHAAQERGSDVRDWTYVGADGQQAHRGRRGHPPHRRPRRPRRLELRRHRHDRGPRQREDEGPVREPHLPRAAHPADLDPRATSSWSSTTTTRR